MSPFGEHLYKSFEDALKLKASEPVDTPESILCDYEVSMRAESIARELAECAAYQLHQIPKQWDKLPMDVQNRFRQLAERVILQIDLSVREKAMAQAIKETVEWMDRPSQGYAPSTADVCRECLGVYESIMCAGAPEARS